MKGDKYYDPIVKTYKGENGKPDFIIRVFHPIISEEEKERRMERIKRAAADLIFSGMRKNAETEETK